VNRRPHLVPAALAVLLALSAAAAAGERGGRADNSPRVGEAAPDFDLLLLKAFLDKTKDAKAEPKWEEADRLKLSSFRGKRPVVFVLSSYT